MKSTVSVIIPTYNRAHCLPRALDSVLKQSRDVDEIIVIDDGSTDDTQSLLKQHYPQVMRLYQPNRGVSAARNQGISAAQTNWIALLDSDDAWHPQKIEKQFNALAIKPNPLCHTNEIWIRRGVRVNPMKKHRKGSDKLFDRSLERCLISPSSALIQRDLFSVVGLFDETLPACEDYDLWLRVTAQFETTFVDEALTIKHGGHEDQLSKKYWGMDRFRIESLQKLLRQKNISPQQRQQVGSMLEQKIAIVLNGAKKRQNPHHTAKLNQWLRNLELDNETL
jgi:glycosyltransferase involved in cell wall biosynthesis